MSQDFTESVVESAALAWLQFLGWTAKHGPEIAPGELAAERNTCGQVVILTQRLRNSLARLSPALPVEVIENAFRKLTRPEGPTLESRPAPSMCMQLTASLYRIAIQRQREDQGSIQRPGRFVSPGESSGGGAMRRAKGVRQPREGAGETHTFIRACIELSGRARF